MSEKTATICAQCHRVVWSTDVDASGHCVFCPPPTVMETKPSAVDRPADKADRA